MTGCPFCEIAAGRPAPGYDALPARWVPLRGDDDKPQVVAFEPLDPVAPGHTLIVGRYHTTHAAADPEVAAVIFECASLYAAGKGAYNLITSAGVAASQTVDHFHVHYVPRSDGDGLHLPWTGQ